MLEVEKDFSGRQIPGARSYQEDAQCFVSLAEEDQDRVNVLLTVLADGMGGENAGDFASQMVVDKITNYCHENFDERNVREMLLGAMNCANKELAEAIVERPELEGMGTTLLAVIIYNNSFRWVSVGDSPLYIYREGTLSQLNEDHSMMPILRKQVEEGVMKEEELAENPDRNVLRAALSGDEIELVDCPEESMGLEPGDILLVASDGLQTLDEDGIKLRLERHAALPADAIALKLIKAVENEENPKQDNTSVNVIRIPDINDNGEPIREEEMESRTRLIRPTG